MDDALSRKSDGSLAVMITRQPKLLRDLEELQLEVKPIGGSGRLGRMNQVRVQFDLCDRIVRSQMEDNQFRRIKERIKKGTQ